jgi:hypothetical protein
MPAYQGDRTASSGPGYAVPHRSSSRPERRVFARLPSDRRPRSAIGSEWRTGASAPGGEVSPRLPACSLINSWRSPRVLRSSGCRDVSVAGSWGNGRVAAHPGVGARCSVRRDDGRRTASPRWCRWCGCGGGQAMSPRIWASPPVDCRAQTARLFVVDSSDESRPATVGGSIQEQ